MFNLAWETFLFNLNLIIRILSLLRRLWWLYFDKLLIDGRTSSSPRRTNRNICSSTYKNIRKISQHEREGGRGVKLKIEPVGLIQHYSNNKVELLPFHEIMLQSMVTSDKYVILSWRGLRGCTGVFPWVRPQAAGDGWYLSSLRNKFSRKRLMCQENSFPEYLLKKRHPGCVSAIEWLNVYH